jgi:SAM-dependent methyltransferase
MKPSISPQLPDELQARHHREVEYHARHADRHRGLAEQRVADDVLTDTDRRWWNHYWCTYDRILPDDLRGKRALVPGCGFGQDVIRLARLGADAEGLGVTLDHAGCESLPYPDGHFDLILCIDILHHTDVARTVSELRRVAKPDARVVVSEIYTHSRVQAVRDSWLVSRLVYPAVARLLYGGSPYITDDERKLNERDLAALRQAFPDLNADYFYTVANRLFPNHYGWATRMDRRLTRLLGGGAAVTAGRLLAWR